MLLYCKMSTSIKNSEAAGNHFLEVLKNRFENNLHRHPDLSWADVDKRLKNHPGQLAILAAMEESGGEPDVVGVDEKTGAFLFFDCAAESPAARRSLCYDEEALASRKANKPKGSAAGEAEKMGAKLMDEDQYKHLQSLQPVDTKTSSWLLTPADVRDKGGAIFGDYRFGRVFIYHNGAESYYAGRGFRCVLAV